MIIETKHKCVDGISSIAEASYHVDADVAVHVGRLLRNNYSRPVLAIIREYTSNAIDSHVKAGVTKPVQVRLPTALEPTFSVRDFGGGLSEADFDRLILGYGCSDKRSDNALIGGMGIGSKAMFAGRTTDSFTYTVWFGGFERRYLNYLDDSDLGKSKLLSKKPSTEPAGMLVSAPVKKELIGAFHGSMNDALGWFSYPLDISPKPKETLWKDIEPALASIPTAELALDNVKIRWSLLSTPHTYDRAKLKVVMGGVSYDVKDPEIDAELHNHFPHSSIVVLYAPIGAFELAPTRETLQSTRKVVRDLKALLVELRTKKFGAATQPVLDLCSNAQEAALKAAELREIFAPNDGNPDKITYRGTLYKVEELFQFSVDDDAELYVLGKTGRHSKSRNRLHAIVSEDQGYVSEQDVDKYFQKLRENEANKNRFIGLFPTGRTYSSAITKLKPGAGVQRYDVSTMLYDRRHNYELFIVLGDFPDVRTSAKFLSSQLTVGHGNVYLWFRSGNFDAFFAKYPWLKESAKEVYDLRTNSWTPPVVVRNYVAPGQGTSQQGKTMPSGIYELQPSGVLTSCASDYWMKAELKPEDVESEFVYLKLDKFAPIDLVSITNNAHYDTQLGQARHLRDIGSHVFGKLVRIFGIKGSEMERLDKVKKSGFTVITFDEWFKKLTNEYLRKSSKPNDNLMSMLFILAATESNQEALLHEARSDKRPGDLSSVRLGMLLRLYEQKDEVKEYLKAWKDDTNWDSMRALVKCLFSKLPSDPESLHLKHVRDRLLDDTPVEIDNPLVGTGPVKLCVDKKRSWSEEPKVRDWMMHYFAEPLKLLENSALATQLLVLTSVPELKHKYAQGRNTSCQNVRILGDAELKDMLGSVGQVTNNKETI